MKNTESIMDMDFTYEGLDFVLQIEYDYDNEKITSVDPGEVLDCEDTELMCDIFKDSYLEKMKSSSELLEAVEHELTEIAQDRHDQACDHAYESARDERG